MENTDLDTRAEHLTLLEGEIFVSNAPPHLDPHEDQTRRSGSLTST